MRRNPVRASCSTHIVMAAAGSGSRYVVMASIVMAAAGSGSRYVVMAYIVMAQRDPAQGM